MAEWFIGDSDNKEWKMRAENTQEDITWYEENNQEEWDRTNSTSENSYFPLASLLNINTNAPNFRIRKQKRSN